MSKEELLNELSKVNSDIDSIQLLSDKENLDNNIIAVKAKIEFLHSKIQDDSNYDDSYYSSKLMDAKSNLKWVKQTKQNSEKEKKSNELQIERKEEQVILYNSIISDIKSEMSVVQNELDGLGKKLKKLGKNVDQDLEIELVSKKEQLARLNSDLELYTDTLNNILDNIRTIGISNKTLAAQIEASCILEEGLETDIKSLSKKAINQELKQADLDEIERLKKVIDEYEEYQKSLYNVSSNMGNLISSVTSTSMNDVSPKLVQLSQCFTTLSSEDEKALREKITTFKNNIERLKNKLADEDNYISFKDIDEQIVKLESRIKTNIEYILERNSEMESKQDEISCYEEEVLSSKETIDSIDKKCDLIRIKLTSNLYTEGFKSHLRKELANLEKEKKALRGTIDRNQDLINSCENEISNIKRGKKELENLNKNYVKQIEARKKIKLVDSIKFTDDFVELKISELELAIANAKANIIESNYNEKIQGIISSYEPSLKADSSEAVAMPKLSDSVLDDEEISTVLSLAGQVEEKEVAQEEILEGTTTQEVPTGDETINSNELDLSLNNEDIIPQSDMEAASLMDEEILESTTTQEVPAVDETISSNELDLSLDNEDIMLQSDMEETSLMDEEILENTTTQEVPAVDETISSDELDLSLDNEDIMLQSNIEATSLTEEAAQEVLEAETIADNDEKDLISQSEDIDFEELLGENTKEEDKKTTEILEWKDSTPSLISKIKDSEFIETLKSGLSQNNLTTSSYLDDNDISNNDVELNSNEDISIDYSTPENGQYEYTEAESIVIDDDTDDLVSNSKMSIDMLQQQKEFLSEIRQMTESEEDVKSPNVKK